MSISFYTLDVGHGLCQIIRFGDRAILIDGGGRVGKRIAEDFLKRYIKVVVAYVATHNDNDHVGAAPELLEHYSSSKTLNSIWLLLDRPAKRATERDSDVIPMLGYAKRRSETGTVGALRMLYVGDQPNGGATLVHRETAEGAELQLVFPKLIDTTDALIRGQADPTATNQVSAILRLAVEGRKDRAAALITGDANCQSFYVAHEHYKFDLRAGVLSVPHHGGEIPSPAGALSWDTIVGWVAPEIAVVSAGFGTVPRSTSTKRKTFEALRSRGIPTCCTQITKHCHPDFQVMHPSVLQTAKLPLPQMSGHKDFPDAVGCAGTITIKISSTGDVNMIRAMQHQLAVDEKVVPGDGCPHCR